MPSTLVFSFIVVSTLVASVLVALSTCFWVVVFTSSLLVVLATCALFTVSCAACASLDPVAASTANGVANTVNIPNPSLILFFIVIFNLLYCFSFHTLS